jgi:hypothetical protein
MDFKDIVRDIDKQISELKRAKKSLRKLGGQLISNGVRTKRTLSAAGRAAISRAQKLRWSKLKLVRKK